MHVLYIHQYFATPAGRTGTRSYEFARRWVQAGHRVTLLTSTARLTPEDLGSARRRLVTRVTITGIEVVAVDVAYRQSMGIARRMWSFLTFMIAACWFSLTAEKPDVVYASSTPLTVGVAALVARWFRGRRFVFEVRDPWPAVPVALGALRNPALIGLARRLERTLYHSAEAVIALSTGMASLVQEVAPKVKRVETIPNCADTDLFRPDIDGSGIRNQWNWGDRVVCVHAGAMGPVNGLEVVVEAAERFRHDADLLFVLVGEGSERARLERECQRRRLTNVQFVDGVRKQDLSAVLAAADLCLMTVTNVPILEHNSANKLFDYLSAGKPVVLNYGGWQRETLEQAGAGVGCDLSDREAFFASLAKLKSDGPRRASMGRAARNLAVERFGRDRLSAAALRVLENVVRD